MAIPTITYDQLPVATLPLDGTETVTFEQDGVTVRAALANIFANVAGVSLLGDLQLLSADGQTLLGALGPILDEVVGLSSPNGAVVITLWDAGIFIGKGPTGINTYPEAIFITAGPQGGGPQTDFSVNAPGYASVVVDDTAGGSPRLLSLASSSVEQFVVFTNGAIYEKPVTTSTRPNAATVGAGARIYDSTIHKPLWSDGTVWRDAMANAV